MFELASALFSIADANEFRFARFYIVCEEVALAPLKSPFIVCGLSDTPVDCQSVAKTRNLMPDAARKKYSHFTLKNTSRSCTHNRFRANVYLYNCPEEISPLRLRSDKRRIIDGDTDVLIVVSERFSVERDTADMLGVILDRETQADVAAVVQVKRERADIGDLKTVDVGAVIIDD